MDKLGQNTYACNEGLIAIDRSTNDTMTFVNSVPLACSLISGSVFAFLISRSIELPNNSYDAINKDIDSVSFIINFENLSRDPDLDEEEFMEVVPNGLFVHGQTIMDNYYLSKTVMSHLQQHALKEPITAGFELRSYQNQLVFINSLVDCTELQYQVRVTQVADRLYVHVRNVKQKPVAVTHKVLQYSRTTFGKAAYTELPWVAYMDKQVDN